PFGPYPTELQETYPLTAEIPQSMDPSGYKAAAKGVLRVVNNSDVSTFHLAHKDWPQEAIALLPDAVMTYDLHSKDDRMTLEEYND
ncbi:MAG: tRNA-guanine(15) transglycosylase, partial [Halobacteriaceae archaeon]